MKYITDMNPFIETLNTKEELFADFKQFAERKVELGQNALLAHYGLFHGEAIEKFCGGRVESLMNYAGIPITSSAYFQAGIRAWNNLNKGLTNLPEQKKGITNSKTNELEPLQRIFYGAPGTGKSNTIKQDVEEAGKIHFRTTFHPDSDYSTFVGCYKPTMSNPKHGVKLDLSFDDLAEKLNQYYNNHDYGKIEGIQRFCLDYYQYIDGEFMKVNVTELVKKAGISDTSTYVSEISKYVNFCHRLPKRDDNKIIYSFTPQSFTNAYVAAWKTEDEVYLIIEEINRGNCAQIFGDLFQLLDRDDDGFSEYPVDADSDLADYIAKELKNSPRANGWREGVKEGKKLVLPNNLYIWATMNTSDQSLFPIDSAFKRRWEWKYIPIKDHEDKNYHIAIGDAEFNWWGFLEKINKVIGDTTSSEDKKLGYFFVKTNNGKVDENQFVGKVLFYLWNDVFKNYGFDNAIFSKNEKEKYAFSDFFEKSGEPNNSNVIAFLRKLDEKIDKEHPFEMKATQTPPTPPESPSKEEVPESDQA